MKSSPLLQIILGEETAPRSKSFIAGGSPIGFVAVDFEGRGQLFIQAATPEPLFNLAAHIFNAAVGLRELIDETSAPVSPSPGADALDVAAHARAADGERLGESAVTGSADVLGDPVAAPPSGPQARPGSAPVCTCVPGDGSAACPHETQCADEWWQATRGGAQ